MRGIDSTLVTKTHIRGTDSTLVTKTRTLIIQMYFFLNILKYFHVFKVAQLD
jgi:hypothetical protein